MQLGRSESTCAIAPRLSPCASLVLQVTAQAQGFIIEKVRITGRQMSEKQLKRQLGKVAVVLQIAKGHFTRQRGSR